MDGAQLHLPDHFAGSYGVVIFNRGSWCPYGNGQLRGFQRAQAELPGAIGRITGDDAVGLIRHTQQDAG